MGNCWAACLGNCDGKISREHVVSRALFLGNQISVQGFAWCKDDAKVIGLSSLTARILCEQHNSCLSEVDSSGADAFKAMREMMRLSNVRSQMKPRIWRIRRYDVDGPKLERWFLKTLINLAFEGQYHIGMDSTEVGRPSSRLVKLCFGLTKFQKPAGLYNVVHVGQQIQSNDTVGFAPFLGSQHLYYGWIILFSRIPIFAFSRRVWCSAST